MSRYPAAEGLRGGEGRNLRVEQQDGTDKREAATARHTFWVNPKCEGFWQLQRHREGLWWAAQWQGELIKRGKNRRALSRMGLRILHARPHPRT